MVVDFGGPSGQCHVAPLLPAVDGQDTLATIPTPQIRHQTIKKISRNFTPPMASSRRAASMTFEGQARKAAQRYRLAAL